MAATSSICRCDCASFDHSSLAMTTSSALATKRGRPCTLTNWRRPNSSWLKARDLRMIRSIFQPSGLVNHIKKGLPRVGFERGIQVRIVFAARQGLNERSQLFGIGCDHDVNVLG